MKINLPPAVRFAIAGAIFVFYLLALVQWSWFDGLINFSIPIMIAIAALLGAIGGGFTYSVLPTKKTVQQSKEAYADKKFRRAVVGYWTWILIWAAFFPFWLLFYIPEM